MNSLLSIDRMRFSLAHELAHLVCHDVPNPQQEGEANRFASEFLMPSADIGDDLRNVTLTRAMELKLYWGTSIQSIIYKSWELGEISDRRMQNYFIEMSRRGWRKNEPIEAIGFTETPTVFNFMINAHLDDIGYSEDELADMFGLYTNEFMSLFPVRRKRPVLRVVASS